MARPSRIQRADAVFLAALAIGLLILWRTAFIESHWDEDAGMAIGWLLSKGWRLYSDVFSHHMPLDYIPSWAISCLFGPSQALCRAFMIGGWALLCCGLWRLEKTPAILFTLLSSLWLTYWMGQMLLVENLWAGFAVLLLALASSPAAKIKAAGAGALLGALLCSSLTCGPVFLLLLFEFLRQPGWRKFFRQFAAGFAGWMFVFLAWSWSHADLGLWYTDAVRFNNFSYAFFSGLKPGEAGGGLMLQALAKNIGYFASTLSWNNLEQYFEGILRLAWLGWIAWTAAQKRWREAAWWAALALALRLRVEHFLYTPPFHGAPFFLAGTWLLSRALVLVWDGLRARAKTMAWAWAWAWAWAAACAVLLAATLVPTALATASLSAYDRDGGGDSAIVDAIKKATGPEDAIAVLPMYPKLYIESGRVPATPSVFYLPWQAAWPEQHERTLAALRDCSPKIVVIYDTKIWGVPWSEYGADIEAWLRENYRSVGNFKDAQLWVRRDRLTLSQ